MSTVRRFEVEVAADPGSGADRARVSGLRWGAPAEPEATLLHGVGLDAHTFEGLVPALGVPAIALDLPGHGRSSWRADADYGADRAAPIVSAALRTLHGPPGIVIGHSLGAIVGARIASADPDLVTGLVLVDMSPDFTQRAVDRIVRALEAEEPAASVEEVAARAVAARPAEDPSALLAEAVSGTLVREDGLVVRRHHFPHLGDGLQASLGLFASAWPDLEALDVPVLLVRGDKGYVSPKLERQFRERLPRASVVTVPARHAVQVQAPGALAAAIRSWRAAHGI